MAFSRQFRRKPKRNDREYSERPSENTPGVADPESTGSETDYLKSLVDSHAKVTVVMKDGERMSGYVRYYDAHCFSLGVTAEGPRFFLRKDSIAYIEDSTG